VLDGCSRRLNEAPVVDGALDFIDCKKRYVIHINVSNEWSKQRLLERGRSDDDEKEIEARLAWYDTNVMPVVENFKNNEKYTFIDVNGEQTIEEVQQELLKKIQL
jgi:adenylate kinase